MSAADLTENMSNILEYQGYKGKILSIQRISELQRDIRKQYQQGLFDKEFFTEELTGFDFKIPDGFPGAVSLIIVAAPQPQVRVNFSWEGKSYPCIIPPTYSYVTDKRIKDLLEHHLVSEGYRIEKANLPLKLLAVRCGLAEYGKNNVSYIGGMGSFYRLTAFVSDLPYLQDNFLESARMERCKECDACMKACPSGAIASDRFLLYGERCLTFHNERTGEFPAWINPSWHNCLVGCMICQKVCPANKDLRQWVVDGPVFSESETACLFKGISEGQIPKDLAKEMEQLDMMEYLEVLGRNLQALTAM